MKRTKHAKLLALLLLPAVFLTGCVQYVNGQPTGWVYDLLGVPAQHLLHWTASFLGGSYGLSIIIVSIALRAIILPISLRQSKQMLVSQEKIARLKPYMDPINERIQAATTQEEKMQLQQELLQLQQLNGVGMADTLSGCLPTLVQIPIFGALYAAILTSPEIANSTFLTIPLGENNLIIVLLTGALYFVQSYMSQQTMSAEMKKQQGSLLYMSPILMLVFTWSTNAGIGLYFLAGAVWMIFQTWLQNTIVRPRILAELDETMKEGSIVLPKKTASSRPVAKKQETYAQTRRSQTQGGRNSGKQTKRK